MNPRGEPIGACVFDLDGTLADSLPGIELAVNRAWDAVMPGPRPDLRDLIGPPLREMFRRACGGEVASAVIDQLEREFRTAYDNEGWRRTRTYPAVRETLEALAGAGCELFVLTNKPWTPSLRILEHLGLKGLLKDIVTPDCREPGFDTKEAAARWMCGHWRLAARATWLVGDSAEDGRAAQACGFRFAAVTYGYGRAAEGVGFPVDRVLHSLGELLEGARPPAVRAG